MLFEDSQILTGFKNSLIYLFAGVAINMVLTMLLAFPLSQKGTARKEAITIFIAATMYVNGGLIPTYLLVSRLDMVDTSPGG